MIVEMRTYRLKPGTRAAFLEIFRTRSMPAHKEIMRGFPDLESREPMKAAFYEGPLWTGELEAKLMPMIEKYDVVVVEADGGLGDWQ